MRLERSPGIADGFLPKALKVRYRLRPSVPSDANVLNDSVANMGRRRFRAVAYLTLSGFDVMLLR